MSGAKFLVYSNFKAEIYKAMEDIQNYDDRTQKAIRGVIDRGTTGVYNAVTSRAPRGPTNNLRIGIHKELNGPGTQGTIWSKAPHTHLIELGTKERIVYPVRFKALHNAGHFTRGIIRAGRVRPRPFMRPAIEQERPKIESEMEEALRNAAKR